MSTHSELLAQRAAGVDTLVAGVFQRASLSGTLLAVGGYGRRELFPFSDVDLLLLVDVEPASEEKDRISFFLRELWDAGLRVSHSVRTLEESCEFHEGNLELTISLLDRRFLLGDSAAFAELQYRFPKFLLAQRAGLVRHLCQMTRLRHVKFGNTIYHLEPNVKEHPGGLRDLHVLDWLAKLQNSESAALAGERDFMAGVRLFLHNHFGRDNNQLSFDAQEVISDDPAAWMRNYFRNARATFRAVTTAVAVSESAQSGLLVNFQDWRGRVSNSEFTVVRERVLLREPAILRADSGAIPRLMVFVARHQLPLSADTEQRLQQAVVQHAPIALGWNTWKELLSLPRAALALRAMRDTGILERLLPEWRNIDCLVTRDFSHRYTVDEHTLVAIEMLESLIGTEDAPRRRFSVLLSEAGDPALLRLALLLHDIGKGGGDHVAASASVAREVLPRLGVPKPAQDTVVFLIEQHLALSSVMTSRDLSDPVTARELADRTGTIEQLRLLTLLTYADISAVHPTAMTPWRLEQLWSAYLAGYRELTAELHTERIAADTADPFLQGLPTRYLRTHSEGEIAYHRALAQRRAAGSAAIDLTKAEGAYRLTVITEDRPSLLAGMSGALAGFGMNILKAEAFANARGEILDTFLFSDPNRTLELNPEEAPRLRHTVQQVLDGKLNVAKLIEGRRPNRHARSGRIPCMIAFSNSFSEQATLIEITGEDRPGLLHDLSSALTEAGCDIEAVLVDTEAHKAMDVFYVTKAGTKLPSDTQEELRAKLLAACG